ncbi:MAG: ADP-ribosylglycohydrolase family protein [Magnetococcales bacterium]|nr:ADP-ribosylglycohydrolase family protein [Magnetococcales bacterium]
MFLMNAWYDQIFVLALRRRGNRYPDLDYGRIYRVWSKPLAMASCNSWDNGATMRVSPAGYLAPTPQVAISVAKETAFVTHDHPEGLKGAAATALAIRAALAGHSSADIRARIASTKGYDLSRSINRNPYLVCVRRIKPRHSPSAGLRPGGYQLQRRHPYATAIGGDSDTAACIAGGVAEALFGIPQDILDLARSHVPQEGIMIMNRIYAKGHGAGVGFDERQTPDSGLIEGEILKN